MVPTDGRIERVRRSHAEAQRNYDRVSAIYDWLEGPFERGSRRAGVDRLALREGERVLEIGFGTGHGLVALAREVGSEGLVVGVELSSGMQRKASRRLARAGLVAPLVTADALTLPVRTHSLDAVFLSFTLELFDTPELPHVLAELRRVLRPEGRVGVVALSLPRRPGLLTRLYVEGHRRFPRLLDCRPIPTRQLLDEAGYRIQTATTRPMWGLPVDLVVASPGTSSRE